MPAFGPMSRRRLATCHPDLQTILSEAIEITDFAILCGHRNEIEQEVVYATGKSRVEFPNSRHNKTPALAVDVAPYPIDWNDTERFHRLAGVFLAVAHRLGIKIEWGGDWSTFVDMPHFQLKE